MLLHRCSTDLVDSSKLTPCHTRIKEEGTHCFRLRTQAVFEALGADTWREILLPRDEKDADMVLSFLTLMAEGHGTGDTFLHKGR